MKTLRVRNVNEAYVTGVNLIKDIGVPQDSRAGKVLVAPHPVMTVYEKPWERVLFNAQRDANPFFHLFESLWMLAGRNDATWLDRFVSDFSKRFAEDGIQHGAYGWRWRNYFDASENYEGGDQLDVCVNLLRNNPDERRVVITMWEPCIDLAAHVKDVPCNTHIYPRIVDGALDLTVMCRSNDIIWGAYGANAVHFSVLLEYMAAKIGCSMGKLYQLSNNWHAYVDVLEKMTGKAWVSYSDPYELKKVHTFAMIGEPELWDEELQKFMEWSENAEAVPPKYVNPWFSHIATPLYVANSLWKHNDRVLARQSVNLCMNCDWKQAALEWMNRREKVVQS